MAGQTSSAEAAGTWPPETRVLPGHGPSSTIEEELRTNPYLRGFGIE